MVSVQLGAVHEDSLGRLVQVVDRPGKPGRADDRVSNAISGGEIFSWRRDSKATNATHVYEYVGIRTVNTPIDPPTVARLLAHGFEESLQEGDLLENLRYVSYVRELASVLERCMVEGTCLLKPPISHTGG